MQAGRARTILVVALALALGLAACADDDEEEAPTATVAPGATATSATAPSDTVKGSGNTVTESMEFADFTVVEVASAFVVDIRESESFSVVVRVDDNLLDFLDVSKADDTLRIRLSQSERFTNVTMKATITMPELAGLQLSGASKTDVSDFESEDLLDIVVSGASTLEGDLKAGSIDFDVSGSSNVALKGSATALTIIGTGASFLDLEDFRADTARVTLSGASEATVDVRESIERVDVSGASRLRYFGEPLLGDVSTSGASTVEQADD